MSLLGQTEKVRHRRRHGRLTSMGLVWSFSCQPVSPAQSRPLAARWVDRSQLREINRASSLFGGGGRSPSRRLRSGSRSARKGSRDRNASGAWRLAALAELVFRSALTPEHAERGCTARRAGSEGNSPSGAEPRATHLYSVDPMRIRTMMQSYASAAKFRGGGPILNRGAQTMSNIGLPPPRIVICSPLLVAGGLQKTSCSRALPLRGRAKDQA